MKKILAVKPAILDIKDHENYFRLKNKDSRLTSFEIQHIAKSSQSLAGWVNGFKHWDDTCAQVKSQNKRKTKSRWGP